MGRYWHMGWAPGTISAAAEKSEQARETLIDSLIDSPDGRRVGLDRDGIENCGRFVKAQGHDQAPTLKSGVAGPARVKGEQFQLVDEHVNAHGERVLEAYRRNGPHWERIHIHEAQAAPHTRVVSRVEGY